MTTLRASPLDDGPPGPRAHAGAEAVLALTAAYIRLIGAFHSKEIQIGEFAVGARL